MTRRNSFKGKIKFDKSKPDGMKLKLLDNSRIRKTKWVPKINLNLGLHKTYEFYKSSIN